VVLSSLFICEKGLSQEVYSQKGTLKIRLNMSSRNEISKEDWEELAQNMQDMPGHHYSEEIINQLDRREAQNLEELVKSDYIDEYTEKIRFFWSELVELNIILYIVEKIFEFPLELFRPNHHSSHLFFGTVMMSFHQTATLIISRLSTDGGSDIYTLFRFKNDLLRHWLTNDGKTTLMERLQEVDEAQIRKMTRQKIRDLRNFRYAHTLIEAFNPGVEVYHPGLEDLKEICTLLNSLFDALTLHTRYGKLPIH
jgi:hypothetical protein